jgi:hypothetical protein
MLLALSLGLELPPRTKFALAVTFNLDTTIVPEETSMLVSSFTKTGEIVGLLRG